MKILEEKQYSFTAIFESNENGGYTVTCPALPGLVTEGDNLEEAKKMAKDAIRCHIESMLKDGLPIPSEETVTQKLLIEEIKVNLQPA